MAEESLQSLCRAKTNHCQVSADRLFRLRLGSCPIALIASVRCFMTSLPATIINVLYGETEGREEANPRTSGAGGFRLGRRSLLSLSLSELPRSDILRREAEP